MRGAAGVRKAIWNEGRSMTDHSTGYQRVPLEMSPVRANARRYEQERRARRAALDAVVLAVVLVIAAVSRGKGDGS